MAHNYLFQNNKQPLNYQIIDNKYNTMRLIATKFNSELNQIIHLLIANTANNTKKNEYYLYNWNTTSNLLQLNFLSKEWNCSIKCEISASATFFLLQNHQFSYLYLLDSYHFIQSLLISLKKNLISILDESRSIRKKSDISKKNYVFASGKDLLALSYNNNTLTMNVFSIPLIYNFNPNNFVLDTKLYQNKLYILYRSIVTYNIYLYEFKQVQLLFQSYPNNTRLNDTGITINEVFRFNNNYISKVIRFVRGVDITTGSMIIWIYNDNQAYKCTNVPCIGFGYEIYNSIVFSTVIATNYSIAFYGKSNMIHLKNFRLSLVSQEIGRFYFDSKISSVDMISNSNFTISKILVSFPDAFFPTVYKMVGECKPIKAYEENNFCKCQPPYSYDPIRTTCAKLIDIDYANSLDTIYIAFIVICSVLLLTLIFIIYRKVISLKRVRKSWQYNAADNIIFQ